VSPQYGTRPKGMQERQVPRQIRCKKSDADMATTSSNVNTFYWRKCKIIMDDESTQSKDLPCLKTALRTRSSASSMIEATLIICGADYDNTEKNEKEKTISDHDYDVKEVIEEESDISSFESYRSPWTHTIGKFHIMTSSSNEPSTSKSMAYPSESAISDVDPNTCSIEEYQSRAEVGIEISDPDEIWSSVVVMKVMQRKSNILVKMSFEDNIGSRSQYHIDEAMRWNKTHCRSSVNAHITKRAKCTVNLVLESSRGTEEVCRRSICHFWPVTIDHTLIIFECRIEYAV